MRDVAIKVLPDSVASDPERVARFQREAQLLAALNHPNIAHIYGVERHRESAIPDGLPVSLYALVMELIDGPTLADLIADGHPEAERVSARLRDGASAAERRGWGPAAADQREHLRVSARLRDGASAAERRGWGPAAAKERQHGLPLDVALPIARQIADPR
jgi:hypothetical protein